jgi:hypothetical protein
MYKVIFKQKATKKQGIFKRLKSYFKKHEVVFYDSAENLPYKRYHKYNKFFLIAAEVGNSVQDYDKRTARCISYLNAEDYKSAAKELNNRRQTVHNAMQEYSNKGLALAVLIYSNDALEEILNELDTIGFTQFLAEQTLNHVKKK